MISNPLRPTPRELIAGMAALPLAGCAGGALPGNDWPAAVETPQPSLNTLASAKGRRFGSCVGYTRRGVPRGGRAAVRGDRKSVV